MKKILFASVALSLSVASIVLFQLTGCTKTTNNTVIQKDTITKTIIDTVPPIVCDVRGRYTGTAHSALGGNGVATYILKDNNSLVGSVKPTDPAVTFGGYRNTCDSVIMSVYYTSNSSYYLLLGKLSNNGNTISGVSYNLTTIADSSTFTLNKY